MNKIAHYLQEHLLGEVTSNADARRCFSTDGSILTMDPAAIVYPRTEEDVRKTASFSWQLAQREQIIPLTPRGGGTNTSGAAIGHGVILAFSAHMDKILHLDAKRQQLTVEPGAAYDKVEQTLFTHGQFLPPCPVQKTATVGGGVSSNICGSKTIKYGRTSSYVKSLRVVLANGEVIETGPLSKRELSKKLGLSSMEGEIYRSLDTLLEENSAIIEEGRSLFPGVPNSAGYNLFDVKKNGHFDLTPLFVGSQGTLGIITEASFSVVPHNAFTTYALVSLPDLDTLTEAIPHILKLGPSTFDFINRSATDLVSLLNPNQLANVLLDSHAALHLVIEFDDKPSDQKKKLKALNKIIEKVGGNIKVYAEPHQQDVINKILGSVSTILGNSKADQKAVPVAEDIAVPADKAVEFIKKA